MMRHVRLFYLRPSLRILTCPVQHMLADAVAIIGTMDLVFGYVSLSCLVGVGLTDRLWRAVRWIGRCTRAIDHSNTYTFFYPFLTTWFFPQSIRFAWTPEDLRTRRTWKEILPNWAPKPFWFPLLRPYILPSEQRSGDSRKKTTEHRCGR